LEIRKANLRKINRDEANAAVTRDELIEALSEIIVSVSRCWNDYFKLTSM
jgi:hypothetical protein